MGRRRSISRYGGVDCRSLRIELVCRIVTALQDRKTLRPTGSHTHEHTMNARRKDEIDGVG